MHGQGMTWIRALFFFIAVTGIGRAAVTAAWKIPVERVAPSFADAPPLAKPPGDSAFFQPGDKLWDLSKSVTWKIPDETKVEGEGDPFASPESEQAKVDWKGDWIVWNSRSRMIVARGPWADILDAEQALAFFESPVVVRTGVEVHDAKESRTLSLVSRSGEKAEMEIGGLRGTIEANASVDPYEMIDCRLEISWPAGRENDRWQVAAVVSIEDGRKMCLARQGNWQLDVGAGRELTDGTPWNEARWLETKEGLHPWTSPRGIPVPERKQLGPQRWLGIHRGNSVFLAHHLAKMRSEKAFDVETPAELQEWVRGPLMDVRKTLRDMGVKWSDERDFAGFDPVSDWLVVLANETNLDSVEELFRTLDDRDIVPPIWIETNPEAGGWGLASRSGESAEIRRSSGNLADSLLFRSEATQGADGLIFDLHYTLDVVAGDAKIGKLEAATTLMKDKPQVIGSGTAPDGNEVKIIVTASTPR